jgi:AhpD family alkylhydroperoxidase
MEQRPDPFKASPKGYQAISNLQQFVDSCGLERPLLELVKMRTSQINGCAYCLDMHSKDARALGKTEQRLYLLNAWPESPQYTDRERAALEWTEALVSESHVEDEVYRSA